MKVNSSGPENPVLSSLRAILYATLLVGALALSAWLLLTLLNLPDASVIFWSPS